MLLPSTASCLSALRIVTASGIALAGVAILARPVPGRAAEPLAYTIPDEGGYGIADCMSDGNACGRAMATSWCEAHGHPHAAAYGMAEDVTGSIPAAGDRPLTHAAVVIRCTD